MDIMQQYCNSHINNITTYMAQAEKVVWVGYKNNRLNNHVLNREVHRYYAAIL